jgi:hypothetical protein
MTSIKNKKKFVNKVIKLKIKTKRIRFKNYFVQDNIVFKP